MLVWDALRAAGRDVGLEPFGYRALDALRMEKGYRYFGVDMTMLETPDEAGLGAFVRRGPGDFIGRAALEARRSAEPGGPARRLRTVVIGEARTGFLPDLRRRGGPPRGDVVGRLRSVAFGPTVGRTIGYVYLPSDVEEGTALEIDVFDERVPAVVSADVLVDPTGDRMRG